MEHLRGEDAAFGQSLGHRHPVVDAGFRVALATVAVPSATATAALAGLGGALTTARVGSGFKLAAACGVGGISGHPVHRFANGSAALDAGLTTVRARSRVVAIPTSAAATAVAAARPLAFALSVAALGRFGAGQGVPKSLLRQGHFVRSFSR